MTKTVKSASAPAVPARASIVAGRSPGLPWLIISQLIVTLALLAFAKTVDVGTQQVIIGAVISNWLIQGHQLGKQVSDARSIPSENQAGA